MNPGTQMSPQIMSKAEYTNDTIAHISKPSLGLHEVLDKAALLQTEPVPLAVSTETAYSSAVAAQNRSGEIIGVWVSEPLFASVQAALAYANMSLGSELFALICEND